jgi:hypothetical protein
MKLTLREFVLLRIAEDHQQASATLEAAWDDAAQMRTALDHRGALETLSALVDLHEPSEVVGVSCPVCGPQSWGVCRQTPECPPRQRLCEECGHAWPCRTLRTVATTWRGYDEFDETWLEES